MPYIKLNDLEAIVIDFTSHCNSMCGNCSRNIDGVTVNPRMPLEHMSLETWKKLFTPQVANQIKRTTHDTRLSPRSGWEADQPRAPPRGTQRPPQPARSRA